LEKNLEPSGRDGQGLNADIGAKDYFEMASIIIDDVGKKGQQIEKKDIP